MSRVFVYPSINIDALMADSELEVANNVISLKGEESKLTIFDSYLELDTVDLCGSVAVLKHLAEKHNHLMIASDMFYHLGELFLEAYQTKIGDAVFDAVSAFVDFATLEMLNFGNEYGWSKIFYNKLVKLRKQNRAEMGVKNKYSVGESVRFDYCGGDMKSVANGMVVFVNEHHAIVRIPCYTSTLAKDINRNTMPTEQVEAIVGKPMGEIREYEYDQFVDMYNPLTFLPYNIF